MPATQVPQRWPPVSFSLCLCDPLFPPPNINTVYESARRTLGEAESQFWWRKENKKCKKMWLAHLFVVFWTYSVFLVQYRAFGKSVADLRLLYSCFLTHRGSTRFSSGLYWIIRGLCLEATIITVHWSEKRADCTSGKNASQKWWKESYGYLSCKQVIHQKKHMFVTRVPERKPPRFLVSPLCETLCF